MRTIRLEGAAWRIDTTRALGTSGGFGAVFEGESEGGTAVAIKRLHVNQQQAGHRELRIARELAGKNYQHVIPVLDSGADAEGTGYYVVMARAEHDLQKIINAGVLPAQEAVAVLRHITAGLEEIANLVHRDLKPQNVLYHDGKWKLADLGIAKFVAESTSEQTLRDCLTPQYAAPEQWTGDRATKRTDVYALGCIGYALLTGSPPFAGTLEQIRQAHLEQAPLPIVDAPPALNLLLQMCLRKRSEARPDLAGVRAQLDRALLDKPPERSQLIAAAAADIAKKQAERESEIAESLRVQAERRAISIDGVRGLQDLFKQFFSDFTAHAPNAVADADGHTLNFGQGSLEWKVMWSGLGREAFAKSRWDVVAGALIRVMQPGKYLERSANLWFIRQGVEGAYRWAEASYVKHPLYGEDIPDNRSGPFGFDARDALVHADAAVGGATAAFQLHSPLVYIDGEDQEAFFDRWMKRLVLASTGQMTMDS